MKVHARELMVGDVFRLHDWKLHVVGLEREVAVGVASCELGFLLHFGRDDVVDIVDRVGAKGPVSRAAA